MSATTRFWGSEGPCKPQLEQNIKESMCIELWVHRSEHGFIGLIIGSGTRVVRFTK